MKIIGVRWFAARECIGIVKVVDEESQEVSYFIGVASGADVEFDKQFIANWGNSFPTGAGNALFD